jgi:AraC family transcriptional regulator, L-rhamnose operon transcriptional activator RhaR
MERLTRSALFPPVGVPIHVNRPQHDGHTPLHQHDFLEIALVVSGKALHRTIHGLATVTAGDVFVLRPGDWHAYEACRGLRLANCGLGLDLLAGHLAWLRHDPTLGPLIQGPATIHLDHAAREHCLAVLDRIVALQADGPELRRIDLIGELLLFLAELGRGVTSSPGLRQAPHAAVEHVITVLNADFARDWALDDLAATTALDPSYLVRLFRKHTGLSPMAWLARARGERAAVLLLTTDTGIADIGASVGWPDPTNFARRFRSFFRQTPSAYREQLPIPPSDNPPADWIQW